MRKVAREQQVHGRSLVSGVALVGVTTALSSLLSVACQGEPVQRVQSARPAPSETSGASAAPTSASPSRDAASTLPVISAARAKLEPAAAEPPSTWLRSEKKGFVVVAPGDCSSTATTYDLVVHFHGLADVVEKEAREAKLSGALAVINAGAWSRDYRREYGAPGTLDAVLKRTLGEMTELCAGRKHDVGRLALSGWSAGYSVIRHILQDSGPERVDAVLLSDGIHASLEPSAGNPRGVLPTDVEAFVKFGKLALEGKKLLSITHSSIQTPDYASTTETTNYLLSRLGLSRGQVATATEPSRDAAEPVSELSSGGLRVRGYEGPTAPDHIWQLRSMGPTLFADLNAWWSKAASAR